MTGPHDEKRHQHLRRAINDLLMYRNGEVQHAKFWANVGYALVAHWCWVMPAVVIEHIEAAVVLSLLLIAPDVVKKAITMKMGQSGKPEAKQP